MASLLSSIFRSKAQSKYFADSKEKYYVVKGARRNRKPVIGSFNKSYKGYDSKLQSPWCLIINIGLNPKGCTEDGLPVRMESDTANKLEDEWIGEMSKLTSVHHIGHLYRNTFLDIYVYVDNPEKVNQYLQSQINKEGLIRPFAYKIKQDRDWETVKRYLK